VSNAAETRLPIGGRVSEFGEKTFGRLTAEAAA